MTGSALMEWMMICVIRSSGSSSIKHTATIKEKREIKRQWG
jgi:hypothetical protein